MKSAGNQNRRGTQRSLRGVRRLIFSALLVFAPCQALAQLSHDDFVTTLYFYNSATNIHNFAALKIEFDTFLYRFGPFQFQPFNDACFFETYVRSRRDGIFFISSWHYRMLKDTVDLSPVYVGVLNGKTTYRGVLSLNKSLSGVKALEGQQLAAAGSEEFIRSLLEKMLGYPPVPDPRSIKILTVPKDIDALMAVSFGAADSAFTSESSLARLAAINPKQYSMLTPIAFSDEILLPFLLAPQEADKGCDELMEVLVGMADLPDGRNILKMLGLDGWKHLTTTEKRALME